MELRASGDLIHYRGPTEAVDDEPLDLRRRRKSELLTYLRRRDQVYRQVEAQPATPTGDIETQDSTIYKRRD